MIQAVSSAGRRHLDQLHQVERQLLDALAAAHESITRCEQALNALTETRLQIAHALEPRTAAAYCAQPRLTQHENGHGGYHALERADHLTAREIEVVQLIAAGHSNRQIADTLFLSPRTIERHIANIYLKIDAHNKAEATSYALRHRLA